MTEAKRKKVLARHHVLTVKVASGTATPEEVVKQERYQRLRRLMLDRPEHRLRCEPEADFLIKNITCFIRQTKGLPTSPVAMKLPPPAKGQI